MRLKTYHPASEADWPSPTIALHAAAQRNPLYAFTQPSIPWHMRLNDAYRGNARRIKLTHRYLIDSANLVEGAG